MDFRSPVFNGFGTIDVEVDHPVFGWIPLTASEDDPETAAIYAAALAAGPAPYVAPPVVVEIPSQITFAQLLIALVGAGWITEAEGDAWLDGTLPAPVLGLIGTLPAGERFAARARAKRPSVILRADPLVNGLALAQGKTSAEIDALFIAASAI